MRRALGLAAAFLRRDALVQLSYRGSFFFNVAGALFALWTLFFIARTFGPGAALHLEVSGGDYFRFALVGVALSFPIRAAAGGVSGKIRELQLTGQLETLIASPVAPFPAVLLSVLYPLAYTVVRAVVLLALGMLFFGVRFPSADPFASALAVVLGMAAYLGLGIFSASFVVVFKRGDPVAWALDSMTFMFAGIFYPVEVLPPSLQALSSVLPATHALSAVRRAMLRGASTGDLAPELLTLAICAAVLLPVSSVALRLAVRKAARDGTLGQA